MRISYRISVLKKYIKIKRRPTISCLKTKTPQEDLKQIGYARISTIVDNSLNDQEEILTVAGCEMIFKDRVKPGEIQREFQKCIQSLNAHDTLIVSRLDHLCQTTKHPFQISRRAKAATY